MAVTKHIFASREEWLKGRKNHIGGSDASACVGMNPYKDNVQLWEEKMGLVMPEDISDKDGIKKTVESEIAFAICLTGNKEKNGVDTTVICIGERENISSDDLTKCLAKSMVDAVSSMAVDDLGAVHVLTELARIVGEAAKEKCLERLSK